MTNQRLVSIALILVTVASLPVLSGCGEDNRVNEVPGATATPRFTGTGGESPPGAPTPTASPPAFATASPPPQDAGAGCGDGSQCVSGNCVAGVCCTTDACPAGERCDIPGEAGQCHAPVEAGRSCYLNDHCQSGFCVDNACCTVAACLGGESCNVAGHAGECTALPTPTKTPPPSATRTAVATRTPQPTAVLRVGAVIGQAGDRVTIAVTLDSGRAMVVGTQNDLHVDGINVSIAARADGSPDCAVEPSIRKPGTAFGFLPNGCTGAACTGIRAVVFATDNLDPIADGSVLYRCNVDIAPGVPDGVYPITIGNVIASNANGHSIPVTGTDGQLYIGVEPPTPPPTDSPTPTPAQLQPSSTPTATATAAPPSALLRGDTVAAFPGQSANFSVTLHAPGLQIAGTQNDLTFDSTHTPIAAKANGRPDCTVNPAIDKPSTSFVFRPVGCSGDACTAIRALVLSTDNTDPIPDGSVLYTCTVNVAATAAGTYPLALTGVIASDPEGTKVPGAGSADGAIVVAGQ